MPPESAESANTPPQADTANGVCQKAQYDVLDRNCGGNEAEENARFVAETGKIMRFFGNNLHEAGPYLNKVQNHHAECLEKLPPPFKLGASRTGTPTGSTYSGGAYNYNRGYSGGADQFAESFPPLSGVVNYGSTWYIHLHAGKIDGQPVNGTVSGENPTFGQVWGVVHKDDSGKFYFSVTELQYRNSTQTIVGNQRDPKDPVVFNVDMTVDR